MILEPFALSSSIFLFVPAKTMETCLNHYRWTKFALCSIFSWPNDLKTLRFWNHVWLKRHQLAIRFNLLRFRRQFRQSPQQLIIRLSQLLQVGCQDHGGDHTVAQRRKGIVRGHQDLSEWLRTAQLRSFSPNMPQLKQLKQLKSWNFRSQRIEAWWNFKMT